MTRIQVGGVLLDSEEALASARDYLTGPATFAYPSYDGYDGERALGPLNDADLLAPVLLNVRCSIGLFEALKRVAATLQSHLDRIPAGARLATANDAELAVLGDLFGVLDEPGVPGAQGTVLAKVLHRKRPHFVPLYDERVRRVYMNGELECVPEPDGHRSWRDFTLLLASAMRADLARHADFWAEVSALAPGPSITDVRALDIVAWWAGGSVVI